MFWRSPEPPGLIEGSKSRKDWSYGKKQQSKQIFAHCLTGYCAAMAEKGKCVRVPCEWFLSISVPRQHL